MKLLFKHLAGQHDQKSHAGHRGGSYTSSHTTMDSDLGPRQVYTSTNSSFKKPQGATLTLYHVTKVENSKSIAEEGLREGRSMGGSGVWGTKSNPLKDELDQEDGVAIIKYVVPKDRAWSSEQGILSEEVSPEAIKEITIVKQKKGIWEGKFPNRSFQGYDEKDLPEEIKGYFNLE